MVASQDPSPLDPGCTRPVRVSDPASLIASVPSLVGFYPSDSLVVVVVARRSDRTQAVRLTMRVDLPPAEAPAELVDDVAASLLAPVIGLWPTRVYLVGYPEPAPERRPAPHPLAALLVQSYEQAGVAVGDSLVVGRSRWWSECCLDPTCCPPEGRPLDTPASLGAQAELVYGGFAPYASRDEVVARVARADARAVRAVRRSLRRQGRPEGEACDALAAFRGGVDPEPELVASALDSLCRVPLRDAVVADLVAEARACLPGGCRLVALAPPGWVAPAAAVLAALAYVAGEGALAWACLDRALDDDPGYSLALLLVQVVRAGLPPDQLVAAFRAGAAASEA